MFFLFSLTILVVRFQDEVGWAFKLFDVDNSGAIVLEEIFDSVKVLLIPLKVPIFGKTTTTTTTTIIRERWFG